MLQDTLLQVIIMPDICIVCNHKCLKIYIILIKNYGERGKRGGRPLPWQRNPQPRAKSYIQLFKTYWSYTPKFRMEVSLTHYTFQYLQPPSSGWLQKSFPEQKGLSPISNVWELLYELWMKNVITGRGKGMQKGRATWGQHSVEYLYHRYSIPLW